MIQIIITLNNEDDILAEHKRDAILEVLKEGEENCYLDFTFDVNTIEHNL